MLLLSKDHLQVGDQEYQVPGLLTATCSQVNRKMSTDMSSGAAARSPWTGARQTSNLSTRFPKA